MLELGPARSAWGGTGGKVVKEDGGWKIEDARGRGCAGAAGVMTNTMPPFERTSDRQWYEGKGKRFEKNSRSGVSVTLASAHGGAARRWNQRMTPRPAEAAPG